MARNVSGLPARKVPANAALATGGKAAPIPAAKKVGTTPNNGYVKIKVKPKNVVAAKKGGAAKRAPAADRVPGKTTYSYK